MSLAGASHACAQTDNRFAIGGEFTVRTSDRASKEDYAHMVARPDVTVTSSLGVERRPARADQFILKVGVVYSIF